MKNKNNKKQSMFEPLDSKINENMKNYANLLGKQISDATAAMGIPKKYFGKNEKS
jgi:hypothetical protein